MWQDDSMEETLEKQILPSEEKDSDQGTALDLKLHDEALLKRAWLHEFAQYQFIHSDCVEVKKKSDDKQKLFYEYFHF